MGFGDPQVNQALFGFRLNAQTKGQVEILIWNASGWFAQKHRAFAFSMMLVTIKWFEFMDIRIGSSENDAGLPALKNMKTILEEEMNTNSPQKTARVAACVFLGIFFLGMSTELFIRPGMIVTGDAASTVRNIAASETLFRLSLVSDLLRQVLLMLLPLVLYKLLKPVDKTIAALMVIFALVGVSISMLNEINHFAVLLLSSNAGYLPVFKADQLNAMVMFFLELRKYGTYIPQILSVWVLLLGHLVFKSGFLPRILGILLMLGGLCYTVSAVLFLLYPNFSATIFGLFAFIGESLFYLWLLIKGINVEEWEERGFESL